MTHPLNQADFVMFDDVFGEDFQRGFGEDSARIFSEDLARIWRGIGEERAKINRRGKMFQCSKINPLIQTFFFIIDFSFRFSFIF